VDTGTRTLSFCVQLDADQVTGLHLIELAASQHGLSYTFGFGGAAVCRLAGVGPQGSDCFTDYPAFWGYWHRDGGGWDWASTGAGSHRLGDGDIDGWVWGEGDTPATHRAPPVRSIDDLCPEQPATDPPATPDERPTPSVEPGGKKTTPPSPAGPADDQHGSGPGGGEPSDDVESPTASTGAGGMAAETGSSPSGSTPPVSERAAAAGSPGGGPPLGLLAAAGLGLALVVGGWLRWRTRGGASS
jgi:hypothetical protein